MSKRLLSFLLFLTCLVPPPVILKAAPLTDVAPIIRQIELRRGNWTAMRADLSLVFVTEFGQSASCQARLVYERLDEQLLLHCRNPSGKLLFTFRTQDRFFSLYLVDQNRVYEGDILDLQNNPEIESHLRPLDLYRALKPITMAEGETLVESVGANWVTLQIWRQSATNQYLSRRLFVSPEGDVLKENFYQPDQMPSMTIERSEFYRFFSPVRDFREPVIYPRRILVESAEPSRSVLLLFEEIRFFSLLDQQDWSLGAPSNAEVVKVEPLVESDPADGPGSVN